MSQDHRLFGSQLWDQLAKSRTRKPSKGRSRRLAIESLEDRRLLAFGRALGSITGTVFNDQNADGARASAESGLAGWVVYADSNNNGSLDRGEPSAVSGRNGFYRLVVPAGTYTIREITPTGWQATAPSGGSYSVSVAARASVTGKDFGNQKAAATVSGTVFNDLDGDGTRDSGESVQSGWQMFADADGDGQYDRGEVTATTGRDGTYRLTLTPGTYTILEVARTGWQITAPSEGSYTVTVGIGDTLTGQDFGNQEAEAEPTDDGDFQIDLTFSGLSASQQVIAEAAAERWEQVIVGDLSDVWYRGQMIDDVLITICAQRMDGVGNVLGESGPEAVRSGRDGLPYLGTVVIDTADIAQMESAGELITVLTHEIAHVLGFGTLWTSQGLLSGTRTSNPVFIGAQAIAEYNTVFGTNATGVPVEAGGGTGTALGHWRSSVFGNELMVGYIHDGDMPLSSITVAAMADLGYEVNLAAADAYSPLAASSSLASAASSAADSTGSSVSPSGGGATTPMTVPVTVAAPPGPNWHHDASWPWGSDARTTGRHSLPSCRWQAWAAAVDDVFSMTPGWV